MKAMRHSKLVLTGAVVAAVVAAIAVWFSIDRPKFVPPRITLLGFTNDAGGARLALFQVSNQSGRDLVRWKLVGFESERNVGLATREATLTHGRLPNGRTEVLALPVPRYPGPWRDAGHWTNSSPWRAIVYFTYDSAGRRFARRFPMTWRPARYRELSNDFIVKSDWIGS